MINIIPAPLSVTELGGVYKCEGFCGKGDFKNAADFLNKFTKSTKNNVLFIKDKTLAEEEYRICVKESGIEIIAATEKGAFYGVESLRQAAGLDYNVSGQYSVPYMEIKDKPRFGYRGFMLDEARHFFGKEHVKNTLDMMALLKLNYFHWHLTDDQGWRIEIKKYPELTAKGTVRKNTQIGLKGYAAFKEKHDDKPYGEGLFYTQEDIKEIVAYAQALHIEIIPEIDMPGHLISAITCYPELSCFNEKIDVSNRWGVMDTIGCCGKPQIYEFTKNVIDEISELFPCRYFHIGGDEVPKNKWKVCPDCQKKIKELGLKNEEELQGYFNNEILDYLKKKGKSMIGWNEILRASVLSDDTIVQWWTGNHRLNGVYDWLKKGNKVVLTNHPYVYLDHFYSMKDLKKTYSLDLDTLGLPEEMEKSILGIEAPQWTEYIRDKQKFDFNTYPRMQALSEICWSAKENKDFASFEKRLESFMKILDSLNIGYAKREVYLCRGLKALPRLLRCHKEWQEDPNAEMLRYNKR